MCATSSNPLGNGRAKPGFTWRHTRGLKHPESPAAAFAPYSRRDLFGGRVGLMGEFGAGFGRIDQRNTSRGGSTYDEARWQPFWEIGAGASVGVGRRVRLYGMYRYAAYRGYAFESHTPAGAPFETIHDAPRTREVVGGFSLSFGR